MPISAASSRKRCDQFRRINGFTQTRNIPYRYYGICSRNNLPIRTHRWVIISVTWYGASPNWCTRLWLNWLRPGRKTPIGSPTAPAVTWSSRTRCGSWICCESIDTIIRRQDMNGLISGEIILPDSKKRSYP